MQPRTGEGYKNKVFTFFQQILATSKSWKLIILAQRGTKESFNYGIPV